MLETLCDTLNKYDCEATLFQLDDITFSIHFKNIPEMCIMLSHEEYSLQGVNVSTGVGFTYTFKDPKDLIKFLLKGLWKNALN